MSSAASEIVLVAVTLVGAAVALRSLAKRPERVPVRVRHDDDQR